MSENLDMAVTISRTQGGDGDCITLCLRDKASGVEIVRGEMTLQNYALAISGLAAVPMKARVPSRRGLALVGCRRHNTSVTMDKPEALGKDNTRAMVERHFAEWNAANGGDWSIMQDGTGSQQGAHSHTYIVERWDTAND